MGEPEPPKEAAKPNKKPTQKEKRVMATFYLSPSLVDKLDQVWADRRRKDRKAQESQIVEEALKAYPKS